MTTTIATVQAPATHYLSVVFAAVIGVGIVVLTGHVQAESLHAATHDVRHANGFPCH